MDNVRLTLHEDYVLRRFDNWYQENGRYPTLQELIEYTHLPKKLLILLIDSLNRKGIEIRLHGLLSISPLKYVH